MTSYTENIIWSLLRTSFSKTTFCYILISINAVILRIHIDTIISYILKTQYEYINIITRMIVSSMLIIYSKIIFDIVNRYQPEFYKLIRFLINNYTEDNFKKWKLQLNIGICCYIYILTYIIELSSVNIRQMIIEYMLCYFLVEQYDKYINGKLFIQSKQFECNDNDKNIVNDLVNVTNNTRAKVFSTSGNES